MPLSSYINKTIQSCFFRHVNIQEKYFRLVGRRQGFNEFLTIIEAGQVAKGQDLAKNIFKKFSVIWVIISQPDVFKNRNCSIHIKRSASPTQSKNFKKGIPL